MNGEFMSSILGLLSPSYTLSTFLDPDLYSDYGSILDPDPLHWPEVSRAWLHCSPGVRRAGPQHLNPRAYFRPLYNTVVCNWLRIFVRKCCILFVVELWHKKFLLLKNFVKNCILNSSLSSQWCQADKWRLLQIVFSRECAWWVSRRLVNSSGFSST